MRYLAHWSMYPVIERMGVVTVLSLLLTQLKLTLRSEVCTTIKTQ